MTDARWANLDDFLKAVGLDEEPLGMMYTDVKPAEGLTPNPLDLPTREKEQKGDIDWGAVFGGFSCVLGHIWRARRKKTAAWFSAENFGCPGGAFYLGFLQPQSETIIHYVSTGVPGHMEGECYLAGPDDFRRILEEMNPPPAPRPYVVFKPLSLFAPDETPDFVCFFCRPENLAGLHQLSSFVTGQAEAVRSPFSAACGGLVAWPMVYQARGVKTAVLGGWDPSARKFFKTDELSFTLPLDMFETMLNVWADSFLNKHVWLTTLKKAARSKRAWKEDE